MCQDKADSKTTVLILIFILSEKQFKKCYKRGVNSVYAIKKECSADYIAQSFINLKIIGKEKKEYSGTNVKQ